MKTDRYTKIVLTTIAACLVWMSLGGPALLPAARAQSEPAKPQRVVVVGYEYGGDERLFGSRHDQGLPVLVRNPW